MRILNILYDKDIYDINNIINDINDIINDAEKLCHKPDGLLVNKALATCGNIILTVIAKISQTNTFINIIKTDTKYEKNVSCLTSTIPTSFVFYLLLNKYTYR